MREALFLVALVLSVIELVRTRARSLPSWSTLAISLGLLIGSVLSLRL